MAKDKYTGHEQLTIADMKKMIEENGIEMIRLEYTDILGINRGKLMPVSMLEEIIHEGIAFCIASLQMSYDNDIVPSRFISETCEDMKIIGDPSTFTLLPHCEQTAMILGDLYFGGAPVEQSPRGFLKKMVEAYHAIGLDPIAASELEFYVYNKTTDGSIVPYTNQPATCYTVNKRIDPKRFLYQMTNTFSKMGFNVLYMNHEYYPGQFEYNWRHANAVRAADENALFKSMSKDIAELNDLMVTFMAKPKEAPGGSGCHFHVSFNDLETGENVCYDPEKPDGISDTLKHFIGGLCKHALGITPFLSPTINCYKRYQPDSFAPIFIGWGYDNRTTYIRVPNERGKATRMEIRAASAASNPYLAMASILAAGLDGIMNKIEPPEVVTTDLYRDISRQTQALPTTLSSSLDALEADDILLDSVGKELTDLFVKLKRKEATEYKKFVTDWEWMTYSYHV
ncbi:glutamine synthetase [Fusibacter paucivorans]|uniref:glutamine synthetase n=1 Tax=Fusibacter paucivorans TaxID=76009 RepID=A0ABS5PJ50_9FIRM|nr:glutamine synthetase family protein [Fusibacter paucivorans]MBS7525115.1 glutamine synthetase [Fusibacter paucivorans]